MAARGRHGPGLVLEVDTTPEVDVDQVVADLLRLQTGVGQTSAEITK